MAKAVDRSSDPSLYRIVSILREQLPRLKAGYRVSHLSVFGSRARGDQLPNSDLDLLAEFDTVPTLFDVVGLEDELSELLGVKVDLVMRSALRQRYVSAVLKDLVEV